MKIDAIKKDINLRINALKAHQQALAHYPPIEAVLAMDAQACYTLFGVGNNTLESVEHLWGMLINGLYDDSAIGFSKVNGAYLITYVHEDHPHLLHGADVIEIVAIVMAPYNYYALNQEFIEDRSVGFIGRVQDKANPDHPSLVYHRMNREVDEQLATFGWEPSDIAKRVAKERDERLARLKKKMKTKVEKT